MLEQPNKSPQEIIPRLPKEHKIALVVIVVVALAVIVLWLWQLKNSLIQPFYGNLSPSQLASGNQTDSNTTADDALRSQDTDHDGLSDWDELNLYKTSPYLDDTDGDGLKDGAEVQAGTNPNCPEGKDCSAGATAVGDTTVSSSVGLTPQDLTGLQAQQDAAKTQSKQALDQVFGGGNQTPAQLRQILLKGGIDQKTLDGMSDADLLKTYQELLK